MYAAFKWDKRFEIYRTTDIGCSIGGFLDRRWEQRFSLTGDDANTLWNRINSDPSDPNFVYISGTFFD